MSTIPFDYTADALRAESAVLRGLSRSLLGHEHDAEDAEQETWLAALQHPPAHSEGRSAWLARVARNFALRMRRRDAARRRWEREAAKPEATPSTLETLERAAVHQQIVELVLALDEPYRTTVLLRFWENRPPREVARLMRVPVSTVRTRVRRGLATVRERLDQNYGSRSAWGGLIAFGTEEVIACAKAAVPASSLVFAGVILMTTKAKVAAVTAVCFVFLTLLFVLLEPVGGLGFSQDPVETPIGGISVGMQEEARDQTVDRSEERTPLSAKRVVTATLGSLLVTVTRASDRRPAAGVLLRFGRYGGDILLDVTSAITDVEGRVRLDGLKPGRMYVDLQMMGVGREKATIEAGEEAEVQMEVAAGISLDGIVVDQGGSPVAGADILIGALAPVSANVVSKTGSDGRFQLRSILHCYVGARAPGHAPSLMHAIVGKAGARLEVRIVLGGSCGSLRGWVLTPGGDPVQDAVIQIGSLGRKAAKLPDGSQGLVAMPIRLRSDAEGRFVVEGMAPGETAVEVRAKELAPWIGAVDIVADVGSELTVNLLSGVTITGTVRDHSAKPLRPVDLSVGSYNTFDYQIAHTDAAGHYRFAGLSPGSIEIRADAGKQGRAQAGLVAIAGQSLEWNPVISTGLVQRGHVLAEDDTPIHAYVTASLANPRPDDPWSASGRTDKSGRFELLNCQAGEAIRIRVWTSSYVKKSIDVMPGQRDLVIRVSTKAEPTVYFTGQVLEPDGKPVEDYKIALYLRHDSNATRTLDPDLDDKGRFKCGPYPPGEYRLRITAKGYPIIQTAWKKLTANEAWNLDLVHLQPPGYLQISLVGEVLPDDGVFRIHDAERQHRQSVRIRGGKVDRSRPLAAGKYYLQVKGKDFLCALHEIEIQAGRVTHIEIPAAKGRPVELEFLTQTKLGLVTPSASVDVEIRDSSNRVIFVDSRTRSTVSPASLTLTLRPGEYQVTASTKAGKRSRTKLEVGDKPVAMRIELR